MELNDIRVCVEDFLRENAANYVTEADAIAPDSAGMRIYHEALLGVAAADDEVFAQLQQKHVVGELAWLPEQWLPGAKSVISVFLTFEERVRLSNRKDKERPSGEWLNARIEGELCSKALSERLIALLQEAGWQAVAPLFDSRFLKEGFASNWSERHAAYAAGLGSFGLARNFITEKGCAGRFVSVITDMPLAPTPRTVAGPFANCSMCGACAKRCPAGAIDAARGVIEGKNHRPCSDFLDQLKHIRENGRQYYGCGKCQTAVPCEWKIPPKKAGA